MARVEIYTRMFCGYCSAAKSLLTRKKAAFTEHDVATVAGHRRVGIVLGVFREQLVGEQAPVRLTRDDVGEGAAPVDREGPGLTHARVCTRGQRWP